MKLREKRKRAQKLRMEHTRLRKKRRLEQTLASSWRLPSIKFFLMERTTDSIRIVPPTASTWTSPAALDIRSLPFGLDQDREQAACEGFV